jgi:hypothetical protein
MATARIKASMPATFILQGLYWEQFGQTQKRPAGTGRILRNYVEADDSAIPWYDWSVRDARSSNDLKE